MVSPTFTWSIGLPLPSASTTGVEPTKLCTPVPQELDLLSLPAAGPSSFAPDGAGSSAGALSPCPPLDEACAASSVADVAPLSVPLSSAPSAALDAPSDAAASRPSVPPRPNNPPTARSALPPIAVSSLLPNGPPRLDGPPITRPTRPDERTE